MDINLNVKIDLSESFKKFVEGFLGEQAEPKATPVKEVKETKAKIVTLPEEKPKKKNLLDDAPAKPAEKALTIDDVRKILQPVIDKSDEEFERVQEALKTLGVDSLAKLPADKYADLIKIVNG